MLTPNFHSNNLIYQESNTDSTLELGTIKSNLYHSVYNDRQLSMKGKRFEPSGWKLGSSAIPEYNFARNQVFPLVPK